MVNRFMDGRLRNTICPYVCMYVCIPIDFTRSSFQRCGVRVNRPLIYIIISSLFHSSWMYVSNIA